ncbi:MAG: 30S ribosomal protein S4 [Chloroflexi bacterium]|nr:30S ribosomal protein S4 [Chloroflexota bacterium]
MARTIGPVCRLCRRDSMKLYLKGDRCYSAKCAIERRNFAPGQHGPNAGAGRRRKISDFSLQLREKQKTRRIYGVLERQFRRYFKDATRQSGVTGQTLLQFLELRLDNIVYRLGFASSRKQARQLVLHGHIAVNGKEASVPSALLKPGDAVSVLEASRSSPYFQAIAKELANRGSASWLSVNGPNLNGAVVSIPSRDQIDTPVKEQLIVEYYSR